MRRDCVLRRARAKDAAQARRLLALAAIYDGAAAPRRPAIGGVTLQIVRDWVRRFNARGAGRPDRPQGAGQAAPAERQRIVRRWRR